MLPEQIALVQSSWKYVLLNAPNVTERFYSTLVYLSPQVRPTLKSDIKEQGKKLMAMFSYVIARLDCLDDKAADIRLKAKSQDDFGIKPEHYAGIKIAFITTLTLIHGPAWSRDLHMAWTKACNELERSLKNAVKELKQAEMV